MKRLSSVDSARGFVMLIMLIDHIREFFYMHAEISDPLNIHTTSPDLFFTRISAHLCAPIFIFLTGLAAWLYQNKTDKLQTTEFLLKRGLFLIFLELTVVSYGWSFSFKPQMIYLQVIWAIGFSMIFLSGMIWVPKKGILAVSLLIIFGHNLLDPISFSADHWAQPIWAVLHDRSVLDMFEGVKIRTSYPVLPWFGVIALGYSVGHWFDQKFSELKRVKNLMTAGLLSLGLFLVLRFVNVYGDPTSWQLSDSTLKTIISFLNVTKYPPSLDFLLFTLGIGFLMIWLFEKSSSVTDFLKVFGQTPMFYYIVHIYLIHVINYVLKAIWGPNHGIYFSVEEVIYLWLIGAALVYPLWLMCRWYGEVKRKSQNPLLKYL